MNYLHSKSIMHRDLKSHNLLVRSLPPPILCHSPFPGSRLPFPHARFRFCLKVGENWKVKVCDFGLARSAPTEGEEANHLMTIVGTNEWCVTPLLSSSSSFMLRCCSKD